MGFVIEGSTKGQVNPANVDENNRLHVRAVNTPEAMEANIQGDAYNINSGVITLTSATDSAVIYVKNNEDRDLHVSAIAVGLGPSPAATTAETPVITVIRNPTAGTIVSSAVAVDINSNRNYGSSKTLSVDAYKGNSGLTLTDGVDHLLFFQPEDGRLFAGIDELLTKGDSIGVKIDPAAGNTSMNCYAAIICHLEDTAGS
jgi:hypothetical protein